MSKQEIEIEALQTLTLGRNETLIVHCRTEGTSGHRAGAAPAVMENIRKRVSDQIGCNRVIVVPSKITFSKITIEQAKQLQDIFDDIVKS